MHLLHIQEGDATTDWAPIIRLEYHVGNCPPYAILSHRWGAPANEVTFQDFAGDSSYALAKRKTGYSKLKRCCLQALEYGLTYAWIDTCCIDKSSSAELTEAINSMYTWYEEARVCFAYLEDVPSDENPRAVDSAFRRSTWFTRGWTLQELIAPSEIFFFSADWNPRPLGDRSSLSDLISDITKIPQSILTDRKTLSTASIAQKMSWASGRQTTRLEDEAYSLMGLFGVNMPTIYGEGKRAFIRLQEELMRQSTDHTIFAWDSGRDDGDSLGMLATSPRFFADSTEYMPMEVNDFHQRFRAASASTNDSELDIQSPFNMTNFGLQIQLPICTTSTHFDDYRLAFLACTYGPDRESTIIFLRRNKDRPEGHFYRTSFNDHTVFHRPFHSDTALDSLVHQRLLVSTPRLRYPAPRVNQNHVGSARFYNFDTRLTANISSMSGTSRHRSSTGRGLDIILRQGDSAVMLVQVISRPGQLKKVKASVICAVGLQNGRFWYHLHDPFYNEDRSVSEARAKELLPHYDIFGYGRYWHEMADELMFTDDPLMSPKLVNVLIHDNREVRFSRWRMIDEKGETVEQLRLSLSLNSVSA